jgi:hypothetical protein
VLRSLDLEQYTQGAASTLFETLLVLIRPHAKHLLKLILGRAHRDSYDLQDRDPSRRI